MRTVVLGCLATIVSSIQIFGHGEPIFVEADVNAHNANNAGYQVFSSGTCQSNGGKDIVTAAACLEAGRAFTGVATKGFRFDQPAGGYGDSTSGRTYGCTLHGGSQTNDMQFFPYATGACGTNNFWCLCQMPPYPPFQVFSSGTCQSNGGKDILTEAVCLQAGKAFTGVASKGFRFDQPAGGYGDSTNGRTLGCTLHGGSKTNDMQFFPYATGACGTNNFWCLCQDVQPTPPPTNKPTNKPTNQPTPQPTNKPTTQPTSAISVFFTKPVIGRSPGSSLGSRSAATWDDCLTLCKGNVSCKGVTYWFSGSTKGTCWLLDRTYNGLYESTTTECQVANKL